MCLAQGYNIVTSVRLEPATPRSRVKNSITEPLHSGCLLIRALGPLFSIPYTITLL